MLENILSANVCDSELLISNFLVKLNNQSWDESLGFMWTCDGQLTFFWVFLEKQGVKYPVTKCVLSIKHIKTEEYSSKEP